MRDMCKISHLTIANNYLYWNLGLLISRPDRVVRCWDRFHHDRLILSLPFSHSNSASLGVGPDEIDLVHRSGISQRGEPFQLSSICSL
ncbi:hypothetical protein V3481_012314 [Fusarium oxysporum f. sp. vasinfectum]